MKFMNVLKAMTDRAGRVRKLRRQLKMTRKCTRELDTMLALLGIDFSGLQMCSLPETEDDK